MRVIILSIAFLFLAFSAQSQILKSAGVWYFLDVDSMTARPAALPNGTELAYVVGTKKIYRWNRATSTWEEYSSGGLTMPFDSIYFTPSAIEPDTAELKFSTDSETLVFGAGGTTIEIGQKETWYVKNQTGSTIAKGTAVMAVGTLGSSGRILVSPMVSNGTVSAKYLLGVTATSIANGADGYVISFGKLRKTNTNTWNEGDVLYCSATTPGALTNVEPSPPNLRLPIAFVVNKHTNNGVLAIRVQTGNELHELHDVDTTGINQGEGLIYNSTSHKWVASAGQLLSGSGTTNRIPIWTGTNTLGSSNALYNSSTKRWTWDSPSVLELPMGTDAQRPSPATTSDFWYNTTSNGLEWYNGTRWAKGLESTFNRGTATRIPFFDANGQITDNAKLLFNGFAIEMNTPLYNNIIGDNAGNASISGISNNLIGYFAGDALTSGSYNNMMGHNAGRLSTASNNNFFGNGAGYRTTGNNNNFFGSSAGLSNTTGSANNFFGENAGANNTTGINNNFFGINAGYTNTTQSNNNYFGLNAGYSSTGNLNNFFGSNAGRLNTANSNNFFGQDAGYNNQGNSNLFFSTRAGYTNTTGTFNVFFGEDAGYQNKTGSNSIYIGYRSGYVARRGSNNVMIGSLTGYNTTVVDTLIGDNNIIIGYRSGDNISGDADNNIIIGSDIDMPTANGDNQLNIGNFIFGTGLSGTGSTISTAKIGLGIKVPNYFFDATSTDAFGLPRGTVAQRPTITTSTTPFRYSTDSTALEYGESVGTWRQLATRAYARSLVSALPTTNIYTANGTITENRTLRSDDKRLFFNARFSPLLDSTRNVIALVSRVDTTLRKYGGALQPLWGSEYEATIIGGNFGADTSAHKGNIGGSVFIGTDRGFIEGGGNSYWNVVVGHNAKGLTNQPKKTAIGAFSEAQGADATAVGYASNAKTNSIALGSSAKAIGNQSIVIGAYSSTSVDSTGLFGYNLSTSSGLTIKKRQFYYGIGGGNTLGTQAHHLFFGKFSVGRDSAFNYDPTPDVLRMSFYGQGNKEASDLSKTQSTYLAGFATDGTVIDVPINTELYNTITSTTSPQTLSSTRADNLINQGGTQATFTLNMPASPVNGQVCMITYNNAITTLTIDGNGNTIVGSAVTTAVAGSQRKFKFYSGIGWIKQY